MSTGFCFCYLVALSIFLRVDLGRSAATFLTKDLNWKKIKIKTTWKRPKGDSPCGNLTILLDWDIFTWSHSKWLTPFSLTLGILKIQPGQTEHWKSPREREINKKMRNRSISFSEALPCARYHTKQWESTHEQNRHNMEGESRQEENSEVPSTRGSVKNVTFAILTELTKQNQRNPQENPIILGQETHKININPTHISTYSLAKFLQC